MDPVTPFEWGRMLWGVEPPTYILEILFRVAAIYIAGVIVLSFADKRSRRQATSFDLMILIALGSAVGDVLFYPTVPIAYALAVLIGILLMDKLSARLQSRFSPVREFITGTSRLLMSEGRVLEDALRKESLSRAELYSMLREAKVGNTGRVRSASLEISGELGVVEYPHGEGGDGDDILPEDR
jgi:uncharacterized membrane protein YcaP (DUF421 family)